MKCVLVTGGAGFIGSHLCEKLLDQNYRVINIDNFNDYYDPLIKWENIGKARRNSEYTLIKADIRDKAILDEIFEKHEIDVIVHLAALAGVRKSLENPLEYIDVDIKGTVNLLECCRKNKGVKLVFASSSSVYGIRPLPFYEFENINSQASPYAAAKAAGELYCRTYNNLYGIQTVCLRFFTVYGPRQRLEMAIHNFTRSIDEGREITIFGDGSSTRDYTYIDDIVEGIVSAVNYDCNFEIFNLGNCYGISLNSLIDLIEKKLGKRAKRKYIENQGGDVFNTLADITKAKMLLGYNPEVSIEGGIERFIEWYNNNRQKQRY